MNDFTSLLKDKVKSILLEYNMLRGINRIIVGFSGGADSVCLLHILNSLKDELGFNLLAVHINHGIRGEEADRDMRYCAEFCNTYDIEYKCVKIDCITEAAKTKESLELCARRLRYIELNSFSDDKCKIATAHNANDNAETVIFNIVRGTALKGASGIPYIRDNIVRPLLSCSREEIECYCRENELKYVIDSTNLQDEYTRNKIRHNILPKLREINTAAIENINNFSCIAGDVSDYIQFEANKLLKNALIGDNSYNSTLLKEVHTALLSAFIVSSFSKSFSVSLDREKIDVIADIILKGGRAQLFGDIYCENVKEVFRYFRKTKIYAEEMTVIQKGQKTINFNGFTLNFSDYSENSNFVNKKVLDNLIDCDTIVGNLYLRSRLPGDEFLKRGRVGTKSLKKLFNENSIPIEYRDILPIICDDSGIVWIYSIGVCSRCSVNENSTNIILVKGENNG